MKTWTKAATAAIAIAAAAANSAYAQQTGKGGTVVTGSADQPAATAQPRQVEPGPYTVSTTLNIRSTPSTSGAIVGQAAPGSTVTALGQSRGEWWLIQTTDNTVGWVSSQYLN